MDFRNAYAQGFARVAACTMPVALADPATNAERVIAVAKEPATTRASRWRCSPSCRCPATRSTTCCCRTSSSRPSTTPSSTIVEATADLLPLVVVGAPLRHGNRLYNCAVVIHRGEVLGVAPKSYLPTYREFYEKRHFASGDGPG